MRLRTFIDRPILSCVISVLILLVGIISLVNLPMEQYPDIAPPTISVSASYTGANAETVQKSVVVPLEEAINGVENMLYMTSTSTNTGSGSIMVYFNQGTDPDMATVNVKNRVAEAEGLLPAEVTKVGVTVQKRQNSMLKILALYSPDDSYDRNFINNYFSINIEPRLSRIKGVGNVMIMGDEYAMRIWMNPAKMAQYKLVPDDVINILADQNVEAATGTLGEDSENTFQYTLKYRGRYQTPEEFENLVVKSLSSGEVLRLKDIAEVELGAQSYGYTSAVGKHPGSTCMISQTSGSNANEIIKEIDQLTAEIAKELPKGLVLEDLMSTKDFLDASIHEVVKTLIEAILLVILVVYVFLQSVRSTIIPSISIIVSLVGTFAFIYLMGFSLNLITLFALVLVIGTVVDDAIVVVEAVQAKFDEGYRSPYKATTTAMDGISAAIVTTSLVFMAVFIPTSFMGGTSGTFYTQFGLTMAVAVGISAVNALTLSPALCTLLMTPHIDTSNGQKLSFSSRFHKAFETSFNRILFKYKGGVKFFFKRKCGLNQRPEISMAYTSFDTKFPQYMVEVDAVKCQRANVSASDVLSVLSGFIGGNYSSNFNRFSKLYRVMVQAKADYRLDKDALNNMFVRTGDGEMAPVGQFITLTKVYGAETLNRFNLYSSIAVNGMPADGYSTGDAINAIAEVAKQTLPVGYGYEFAGMTREEAETNNTVIVFAICIIFVYLILCALYESLFIPLAVMLSVPFGLMGSFLFAKLFGLENNIYMQVGLIMLIGLLAKTAILLTEYASTRRKQGMSIAAAAMSAAGVRLRPILMTVLTMVFGMLPLVFASGAGANGNISLGLGVVGGITIGTLALLFVVPVFFIVFQTIQERVMPNHKQSESEQEQEV